MGHSRYDICRASSEVEGRAVSLVDLYFVIYVNLLFQDLRQRYFLAVYIYGAV